MPIPNWQSPISFFSCRWIRCLPFTLFAAMKLKVVLIFCFVLFLSQTVTLRAAGIGTIHGTVKFGDKSTPWPGASVLLVQLNRSVVTGADGAFEFKNVPAGQYSIATSAAGIASDVISVTVADDTV